MGKSIIDLSSVTTVGLDLAKHVFQVHGVDASGRVVIGYSADPGPSRSDPLRPAFRRGCTKTVRGSGASLIFEARGLAA
jgi:hypothetical protein